MNALELVAHQHAHVGIVFRHVEVGQPLLGAVEAVVPAHRDVALGVRLLDGAVVVRLQLDESAEGGLVPFDLGLEGFGEGFGEGLGGFGRV